MNKPAVVSAVITALCAAHPVFAQEFDLDRAINKAQGIHSKVVLTDDEVLLRLTREAQRQGIAISPERLMAGMMLTDRDLSLLRRGFDPAIGRVEVTDKGEQRRRAAQRAQAQRQAAADQAPQEPGPIGLNQRR